MTMHTAWMEPSRSINGRLCAAGIDSSASPKIAALMTICSMLPLTKLVSGSRGSSAVITPGKSATPGRLAADGAAGSKASLKAARIDRPSIRRPGSIVSASPMPIATAAMVVARKKPIVQPLRRPSESPPWPAQMPRITEATTSGVTTNWMASRNNWPGRASQLATTTAMSTGTSPVAGPSAMPAAIPASIAAMTCSQSRSRNSPCS